MVTDGAFAHNIIKSALHYKGDRYFYYYDHLNERSFNEVWGGSSTMKFLGTLMYKHSNFNTVPLSRKKEVVALKI